MFTYYFFVFLIVSNKNLISFKYNLQVTTLHIYFTKKNDDECFSTRTTVTVHRHCQQHRHSFFFIKTKNQNHVPKSIVPVFSVLDINSAFWSIPVKPEHRERLAFVTEENLYQWKVFNFQLLLFWQFHFFSKLIKLN